MCVNIESVKPCKVLRVALYLIFHQYNVPDSRHLFSRYFFTKSKRLPCSASLIL